MSDRTAVERAVNLYFEGMNSNDPSIIPLAEDVVVKGPMMPEPLRGEAQTRWYFEETAPFMARMDRKQTIIEGDTAAVILEFEGLNGVVIEGAEFFQVRDGLICLQKIFFDTRPLLQGAQ